MSFKLVHKNKNGTFKIILKREVSQEEMEDFCQLAHNVVPMVKTENGGYPGPVPYRETNWLGSNSGKVYGPQRNPSQETPVSRPVLSEAERTGRGFQTKLGEKPVEKINMGTYSEPDEGVRIKVLHFVLENRMETFKTLRAATGLGIVGCREIVWGNYPCPILTPETAQHILEEFQKLTPPVFAKIVPAEDYGN